jgi:hypothetical protein
MDYVVVAYYNIPKDVTFRSRNKFWKKRMDNAQFADDIFNKSYGYDYYKFCSTDLVIVREDRLNMKTMVFVYDRISLD